MISLTCGILNKDTNELTYKTEIDSENQRINVWTPTGEKGWDGLGGWD